MNTATQKAFDSISLPTIIITISRKYLPNICQSHVIIYIYIYVLITIITSSLLYTIIDSAAYGQSKLANILFTNELSHRAKARGSGITANSLHPGFIVTDLMRHIQAQVQDFGDLAALLWGLGEQWIFSAAMNADDGALTQVIQ